MHLAVIYSLSSSFTCLDDTVGISNICVLVTSYIISNRDAKTRDGLYLAIQRFNGLSKNTLSRRRSIHGIGVMHNIIKHSVYGRVDYRAADGGTSG
jgi:hypothetical protein